MMDQRARVAKVATVRARASRALQLPMAVVVVDLALLAVAAGQAAAGRDLRSEWERREQPIQAGVVVALAIPTHQERAALALLSCLS